MRKQKRFTKKDVVLLNGQALPINFSPTELLGQLFLEVVPLIEYSPLAALRRIFRHVWRIAAIYGRWSSKFIGRAKVRRFRKTEKRMAVKSKRMSREEILFSIYESILMAEGHGVVDVGRFIAPLKKESKPQQDRIDDKRERFIADLIFRKRHMPRKKIRKSRLLMLKPTPVVVEMKKRTKIRRSSPKKRQKIIRSVPKNWVPLRFFIDRYGYGTGVKKFMEYVEYLDGGR